MSNNFIWEFESDGITSTFHLESFTLRLHSIKKEEYGQWRIGYKFEDNGQVIFEGDDLEVAHHEPVGLSTVEDALSFFSLEQGDTDDDYFDSYTPEQLAWRDTRAAELSIIVNDLSRYLMYDGLEDIENA